MTELLDRPTTAPMNSGEPHRPAEPDARPTRHLRRIVGIKEDLLDWAPEDRAR
jgi:hypothetical protein